MERLTDLALSPFDEAYKSVCGHPGVADKPPAPTQRTLYIAHEIEEHMALAFQALIHDMCDVEHDPDDITVVINTLGGEVEAGFGIYDAMRAANESGNDVTAVVRGTAMSMGIIILQAAKVRKMTKNSYLMTHKGWGPLIGNVTELERDVAYFRATEDHCNRVLAARSKMTLTEIRKRTAEGNWYMNAKDALRFGFVDEVI